MASEEERDVRLFTMMLDEKDDEIARLAAALDAREREVAAMQEEIERWQTSTMLVNGHGDAEGITPEQNERNIKQLTGEVAALRRANGELREMFATGNGA